MYSQLVSFLIRKHTANALSCRYIGTYVYAISPLHIRQCIMQSSSLNIYYIRDATNLTQPVCITSHCALHVVYEIIIFLSTIYNLTC